VTLALTGAIGPFILFLMTNPRRIFVFDKKELLVLSTLSVTVAAFSFTLGVHLGKTVSTADLVTHEQRVEGVEGQEDPLPNRQEFVERGKGVDHEADLALSQSLHTEVSKTGIKIENAKDVDLPTETKTKSAGATTLSHAELKKISQITPEGRFTLQVGSFPSENEAKALLKKFEEQGTSGQIQEAEVKNVGKRYRLFVGAFDSKDAAQTAGKKYQAEKLIENFMVTSRPSASAHSRN
jgi:cell division protein FtsN